MTIAHFTKYNGNAVEIEIDGRPALGVLFCDGASLSVTTLCYKAGSQHCPVIRHKLTEAELLGLRHMGRGPVGSSINIVSTGGSDHGLRN